MNQSITERRKVDFVMYFLTERLIYLLLAYWMICLLTYFDWFPGWQLIDWLIDWLIDRLTGWLCDWLIDWLFDWLILANRTESRLVEDWICPSAASTLASMYGTSRRSGADRKEDGSSHRDGLPSVPSDAHGPRGLRRPWERDPSADSGALTFHVLVTIVGCLLGLMSITGLISYCKAVRNWSSPISLSIRV